MAKYTYYCNMCDKEEERIVTDRDRLITCSCGIQMIKMMPRLSPATTTEVVNSHTKQEHIKDQDIMVKARRDEYYWKVEVPRLVASGTYSVETMLENGWITIDDSKQIVIQTKPPHKR